MSPYSGMHPQHISLLRMQRPPSVSRADLPPLGARNYSQPHNRPYEYGPVRPTRAYSVRSIWIATPPLGSFVQAVLINHRAGDSSPHFKF